MKRIMILLPTAVLLVVLLCSIFTVRTPAYEFTLKKETGDASAMKDVTYKAVLTDGVQSWTVHGNATDLDFTTRFLDRDEVLRLEYSYPGTGFYLYVPQLKEGKKITDYEKKHSTKVKRDDGEDVNLDYYRIDQVDLDLMVSTKDGYACFPSGLTQDFKTQKSLLLLYDPAKKQVYRQADYKKEGKTRGQGFYHASVVLNDKTYVALYGGGQGSSGQLAIYRIDASYTSTSEDIPDVEEVKKVTKAEKIVEFPPEVSSISDIVAYNGKLHVAIQRENWIVLQTYDGNGKLLQEIVMDKRLIFHKFQVYENRMMVFTSQENLHNLKIYDQDELAVNIKTEFPLHSSKLKFYDNKVAAISLITTEDYKKLKLSVFNDKEQIYEGELTGDFIQDQKAVEHKRELAGKGVILPDEAVREVVSYEFE